MKINLHYKPSQGMRVEINLLLVVVVLATLKYFGVQPIAGWDWVWIFSPLWIAVILMVLGMAFMLVFVLVFGATFRHEGFKSVDPHSIKVQRIKRR